MKTSLSPAAAAQIPLPVFAEQVISGMVLGYRVNAPLLRAMRTFVQGRANTSFWKKACKMEVQRHLNMCWSFFWPTAKKSSIPIRAPP